MKPIPNFPKYFADIQGGIYSTKYGKLRKLKPSKDRRGYCRVTLRRDCKSFTRKVGRLVLETFVGARPKGKEVCHGQGGTSNDSLENLSWCTHSQNVSEDKLRNSWIATRKTLDWLN